LLLGHAFLQTPGNIVDTFKALLITRDEATRKQSVGVATLTPDDLMEGDVDVRVEYSTINYKDGLAISGTLPVVRRFPMIPGVDFAGTVEASSSPEFKPGDPVVLNGWGIGETHLGAFSQMARVNADWLIPLPAGFTMAETMAIGTAGYTAMLAVMALERAGIKPDHGPVLVTGAAGGVGSMAITLLAGLGFTVEAATGRVKEADYLMRLGAATIVDRAELTEPAKMLARERWVGAIDSVGGNILANVLSMTRRGGAIAACGNAAGMELLTSVAPFILRGVSLLGIDSVYHPRARRLDAWSRLGTDMDRDKLAAMTTTIGFDDIMPVARDILEGKLRGRTVVEIG
jgi:acrylyl-CoA reductase (NADPH)